MPFLGNGRLILKYLERRHPCAGTPDVLLVYWPLVYFCRLSESEKEKQPYLLGVEIADQGIQGGELEVSVLAQASRIQHQRARR